MDDPSNNLDDKFKDVIPTAILTAFPRTFSDIPYSQEIFDQLVKTFSGKIDEDLMVTRIAVELEARSKLIDKLLAKQKATQVIELAAGFTARGLVLSQASDIEYVELDLPEVADRKRKILDGMVKMPDNLHIVSGNALRTTDFDKVSEYLNPTKEVTIINEGLLRYLSFEEKAILAKNILNLLQKLGGVWITGDGATRAFRNSQDHNVKSLNTTILNQTKRNDIGNAFEDRDHFESFFQSCGFSAEFHDFNEAIDELSSPQKLGLSDEEVRDKLLAYASVVILRPLSNDSL